MARVPVSCSVAPNESMTLDNTGKILSRAAVRTAAALVFLSSPAQLTPGLLLQFVPAVRRHVEFLQAGSFCLK